MSDSSLIPTTPVWDLIGREPSDKVKYWERFKTQDEAVSRLRELQRVDDGSLEYSIVESESIVPDRTMPTASQRRRLCDVMHSAFVALRYLGYQKKHEVIADLADAFHNLPHEMYCEEKWDWNLLEAELIAFESKYPDDRMYLFSEMVRAIRNEP